MSRSTAAREFWAATLAGVVVVLASYLAPGFATLVAEGEYRSVDWRFHVRGPQPPCPDVVLVAVDETSLQELGQWPWPRRRMADLLEAVEQASPALVAFDILFAEPDTHGGDHVLTAAIRRYGNVYLPLFITDSPPPRWLFELPSVAAWHQSLPSQASDRPPAGLYRVPGLAVPLKEMASAAAGLGIVDLVGSGDGVYRDIALVGITPEGLVPSLPLVLAAARRGLTPQEVKVLPGEGVVVAGRVLPLDSYGLTAVNFVGPTGTYPSVSALDVLAHKVEALRALRGKIVLLGATAAGLYDLRPSPFDANFRGVEALATATGNVLSGDVLTPMPQARALVVALLVVCAVAAEVALLPGVWSPVGAALIVLTYWMMALVGFSQSKVVMPLVPVTLGAVAALVAGLAARLTTAERQQRRAVEVFSRFVPPAVARQLVDADLDAASRGQRRIVTVLFADIRNSSVYAQHLSPEDFVEALNRFFAEAHAVVWRHAGTLDKFLGDGVLAFFNAPTSQPDHALRAVRTARDLVRMVRRHRELWEFYGLHDLGIGVGLATGEVVVGYVGSEQRMQYTVIGASVNLAARLQELARDLGVEILMSEQTWREVSGQVEAEELGAHAIRGFEQPVRVWRVRVPYSSSPSQPAAGEEDSER